VRTAIDLASAADPPKRQNQATPPRGIRHRPIPHARQSSSTPRSSSMGGVSRSGPCGPPRSWFAHRTIRFGAGLGYYIDWNTLSADTQTPYSPLKRVVVQACFADRGNECAARAPWLAVPRSPDLACRCRVEPGHRTMARTRRRGCLRPTSVGSDRVLSAEWTQRATESTTSSSPTRAASTHGLGGAKISRRCQVCG
jgi:hypothetical protein